MKLLTLALFLSVCLMATRFVHRIMTVKVLRPADVRVPAPRPPEFTMNEIIRAVARKHKVKAAFVKSIIAAESAFKPQAVSNKGAIGLMQLMPATAREYGAADPTIPEQNMDAGTRYLSWLLRRYSRKHDQLRWTIAAYNAGPGAVERYRGIPPYRETRTYVARVMKYFNKYKNDAQMAD